MAKRGIIILIGSAGAGKYVLCGWVLLEMCNNYALVVKV